MITHHFEMSLMVVRLQKIPKKIGRKTVETASLFVSVLRSVRSNNIWQPSEFSILFLFFRTNSFLTVFSLIWVVYSFFLIVKCLLSVLSFVEPSKHEILIQIRLHFKMRRILKFFSNFYYKVFQATNCVNELPKTSTWALTAIDSKYNENMQIYGNTCTKHMICLWKLSPSSQMMKD